MARSLRALVIMADQVKSSAEAAAASVDDMLSFVNASNERIDAMEAAHRAALAQLRREDAIPPHWRDRSGHQG